MVIFHFFQWDFRNLYVKMRKMHAVNDAMDLLQFGKVAKERNSKFQYVFTTDEEKRLEHIFWSHPLSFVPKIWRCGCLLYYLQGKCL